MVLVALAAVFITSLLVANVIAVKVLAVGPIAVSAGVLAYPLTFVVTDSIAEVYGRKVTTRLVWIGFVCSLLMVAFIYVTGALPGAGIWEAQEAYDRILGGVPRVVLGSMVGYLVSQNHDVYAFDFWRRKTNGRHLWFRNNASTLVSQAIDTSLFITIAFWGTVPNEVFVSMLAGQYIVKVVIALVDTPIVYGVVMMVVNERMSERDQIAEAV